MNSLQCLPFLVASAAGSGWTITQCHFWDPAIDQLPAAPLTAAVTGVGDQRRAVLKSDDSAGPTCLMRDRRNCFRQDLPNGKVGPVASPAACCTACAARANCSAFSFDRFHGNYCYLKYGCEGFGIDESSTAGVLQATTFPPALPPELAHGAPLPRLNIGAGELMAHGASSGGDFAVQFHVAFSARVSGLCGFSAQPYHCAGTRFPDDALMPQSAESSVPFCTACPPNQTLVYDHCKNHPEWVDVGMLPDYPRRVCGNAGSAGCLDDVKNIANATIYLNRGECQTYVGGAEANTAAMYGQMTKNPDEQILYFDSCNPDSSIPYANDSTAMCLHHVLPKLTKRSLAPPSASGYFNNTLQFGQWKYADDPNVGFQETGFLYVPRRCADLKGEACSMIVFFHGCGGMGGPPDPLDSHVRYAESNGIVLLYPRIRKGNNASRTYPNSHEIERGCWDGYGQLSAQYALQSAPHMRAVWAMVAQVTGWGHSARKDCTHECGN